MIRPFTKYLAGYVVFFIMDDITGNQIHYHEKRVDLPQWPFWEDRPVVFKTREAAVKKAKELLKTSKYKHYVRGYSYETENLKYAKGLQFWDEVADKETAEVVLQP